MEPAQKSLTPYIPPESNEDRCPKCNTDFYASPIPYEYRWAYSSPYIFLRKIAIYSDEADRTTDYECPDCGHIWEA